MKVMGTYFEQDQIFEEKKEDLNSNVKINTNSRLENTFLHAEGMAMCKNYERISNQVDTLLDKNYYAEGSGGGFFSMIFNAIKSLVKFIVDIFRNLFKAIFGSGKSSPSGGGGGGGGGSSSRRSRAKKKTKNQIDKAKQARNEEDYDDFVPEDKGKSKEELNDLVDKSLEEKKSNIGFEGANLLKIVRKLKHKLGGENSDIEEIQKIMSKDLYSFMKKPGEISKLYKAYKDNDSKYLPNDLNLRKLYLSLQNHIFKINLKDIVNESRGGILKNKMFITINNRENPERLFKTAILKRMFNMVTDTIEIFQNNDEFKVKNLLDRFKSVDELKGRQYGKSKVYTKEQAEILKKLIEESDIMLNVDYISLNKEFRTKLSIGNRPSRKDVYPNYRFIGSLGYSEMTGATKFKPKDIITSKDEGDELKKKIEKLFSYTDTSFVEINNLEEQLKTFEYGMNDQFLVHEYFKYLSNNAGTELLTVYPLYGKFLNTIKEIFQDDIDKKLENFNSTFKEIIDGVEKDLENIDDAIDNSVADYPDKDHIIKALIKPTIKKTKDCLDQIYSILNFIRSSNLLFTNQKELHLSVLKNIRETMIGGMEAAKEEIEESGGGKSKPEDADSDWDNINLSMDSITDKERGITNEIGEIVQFLFEVSKNQDHVELNLNFSNSTSPISNTRFIIKNDKIFLYDSNLLELIDDEHLSEENGEKFLRKTKFVILLVRTEYKHLNVITKNITKWFIDGAGNETLGELTISK